MSLLNWIAPLAGILTGLAISLYIHHHTKGETS